MNKAYKNRLEKNISQLMSYEEFEKSDDTVHRVMEISRHVLQNPGDFQSTDWLLQAGAKLAAFYSYIEGRANELKSQAEVAEITYDNMYDDLLMAYKNEDGRVTYAKAKARQELAEAKMDMQAKSQKANYYKQTARAAEKMVSFIQSTLRNKETEKYQSNQADNASQQGY